MNVSLRDIKKDINSSEDILVFFRKNKLGGKYYRDLIKKYISDEFGINSFTTISEYDNSGDIHINLKNICIQDLKHEDYKIIDEVIDINDVIIRERYFRSGLDYYKAHKLIIKCSKFFIDLFKEKKCKLIIGQPVDNYVMDIMTRIAAYYNIYYYGLCKFIYSDYVRITTKGEINKIREVNDEEIIKFKNRLSIFNKNIFYNSKFNIYKSIIASYIKYKLKCIYHYFILHKLLGKLEYDFISVRAQVYNKSIINTLKTSILFNNRINDIKTNKQKSIYIPLHYFPEGTTEYWIKDSNKCTYYPYLTRVVNRLSKHGFNIYIKEHPAQYLKRDYKYLKDIGEIKNVVLLSPFINTSEIVKYFNNVLIWNGTTGLEFLAKKLNVYKACDGYYTEEIPCIDDLIYSTEKTSEWDDSKINIVISNILSGTTKCE